MLSTKQSFLIGEISMPARIHISGYMCEGISLSIDRIRVVDQHITDIRHSRTNVHVHLPILIGRKPQSSHHLADA
jgi:hypothetical protein